MLKTELPIASDEEVATIVSQFENRELPYKHWTHRAHLAVAIYYSRNMPYEEALIKIRKNINAYNIACGDPDGYNETITRMFMRKIYSELAQENYHHACYEEVKRISELCSPDWLFEYFTASLLFSDEAKKSWLPPDLTELDF